MFLPVKITGIDESSEFFISSFDGSLRIKSSLSECTLFIRGDRKTLRNVKSRMQLRQRQIKRSVDGNREVKLEDIKFGSLRFL